MANYRYDFEELRLIPNVDIFAYGYAELVYELDEADPSVGYRGGIDWYVHQIVFQGASKDDADFVPEKNDPLLALAEKALEREEDRIVELLWEDAREYW